MEYEQFKNRLKKQKMKLIDFCELVDIHQTTTQKWKENKVPVWAIKLLELLEKEKEFNEQKKAVEDFCKTLQK